MQLGTGIPGSNGAPQRVALLLGAALAFAGCSAASEEGFADALRVRSSAKAFTVAAEALASSCNHPAEFGRCGCYLDGIQTSCGLVARCLEAGFCEVEASASEASDVESDSEVFSSAAQRLLEVCRNPAEFGRCGCRLDGLLTDCSIVHRCLELGFCRIVRE